MKMISEEGYKNIIRTYEIETNQLYQDIANLEQENQQLKDRINKATNNLECSIKSINDKLSDKEIRVVDGKVINPINDYRIVRLKGIRTKCKEILRILKGEENE